MKEMTYEQAMQALKDLEEELESGELSLDEMLETYAKAVDLVKVCSAKLREADKKMTVLVEEFEGEMKEIPFREEDYRG